MKIFMYFFIFTDNMSLITPLYKCDPIFLKTIIEKFFLWVFYHKEYRLFFMVSEHSGCPFPVFHSVKLALHTGIRTHNVKVGSKLKANRTLTDQKRKKLS